MTIAQVGVIGAGVMGTGVAHCVASHGFSVVLIDQTQCQLAAARERILDEIRLSRLLSAARPALTNEDVLKNIAITTSISALSHADLVIENVTETWSAKEAAYHSLDGVCQSSCVFVANPSVFPICRIASLTGRPKQVIGVHFMNPVALKGVVELAVTDETSPETVTLVENFLAKLGKTTIRVTDSPGFVSNRVLMPMINDAIELVYAGVATVETVDRVFKSCCSHQMGPLETADLIGLDTVLYSLKALQDYFGYNRYQPSQLLIDMVASGKIGRKCGTGFYNYDCTGARK